MLEASHIRKTYNNEQKVALDDFSLHVPAQSIYGLLGPNGAGKTSFIRIVNQITQADSGELRIAGELLQPKHIQEIGYMPEERGLYKNMTVGDQIIYFGQLKGMTRQDALAQARLWFDTLQIEHWWKKKLSELSKGMAQKIQFVVTVLHRPKLLILDEPFSGFDPVNANLIKDQILRLKEDGTTIILSTHRMESVDELCDYIALINNAKKVLDGRVFDVREQFKGDRYVVTLVNATEPQLAIFTENNRLHNLRREHTMVHFEVEKEKGQPQLLQELAKVGTIRLFEEKIPPMNEVFIQAVSRHI